MMPLEQAAGFDSNSYLVAAVYEMSAKQWLSSRHEHGSVLDLNSGSSTGKFFLQPANTPKQGTKMAVLGELAQFSG